MITNKRKFKRGIQKTILAITLAFIGPVIFVFGTGNEESLFKIMLSLLGGLTMISCVILGVLGIKDLLAGFFEKTNE